MKTTKFYAVSKGKTVGIFTEWSVCHDSIYKYHFAAHKSFLDINSAINYLRANQTFDNCCDIPVYVDVNTVRTVKDYDHKCSRPGFLELSVGNNESEKPEKYKRQDTAVNTCKSVTSVDCEQARRNKEARCQNCDEMTETDTIECCSCKSWSHFSCTKLPRYQLFVFVSTSRKFTCEKCVEIPEDFFSGPDITPKMTTVPDFSVRMETKESQTDFPIHTIESEFQEHTVTLETKQSQTETNLIPEQTIRSQNTQSQTERPDVKTMCTQTPSIETRSVEVAADLMENNKKENTCDILQDGLVKILDQVSDVSKFLQEKTLASGTRLEKELSVGDESVNYKKELESQKVSYEKQLQKQVSEIKVLKDESLKLKGEFEKQKVTYDKQRLKYEKECEELNSKVHKIFLEAEIEKARLKGEIEVKEVKITCQNNSQKVYETELKSLLGRFDSKCKEIINLEDAMKHLKDNHIKEINKLEDMIKNLKDRKPETAHPKLLTAKSSNTDDNESRAVNSENESFITVMPNKNKTQRDKTQKNENNNDTPVRKVDNNNTSKVSQERPEGKTTYIGQNMKTSALIVGTSNTKFLSAKYIGDSSMYVKKVQKFTVKETTDFITKYEGLTPDVIAYQVTCNDIESKQTSEVLYEMENLINSTNAAFGKKPVVISLPLPRKEPVLNQRAQHLSAAMVSELSKFDNVSFSNNSNLMYRGQPLDGILYDKKHLSRWGNNLLARNLRDDIRKVLWKQ